MSVQISPEQFEQLVEEALAAIPGELFALLDNCVLVIADDAPADWPDLLGLYEGIPLTERDSSYAAVAPDSITIYRNPILAICDSPAQVVEEVYTTVVHEVAHFFGIDDDRLDELGYA